MHLPFRRSLAWILALAAGLLLVACQPEVPVDPLDAEVEFTFQVTNPEEFTGPVFGVLRQPFEEGAFLRAQIEPANLDALLNAFVEAALAPVQELLLWDGATVDEMGNPLVDGWIVLGSSTSEPADGVETWTNEAYLPVVSRAAWTATTDGPCSFESDWGDDFLLDLDLAIDVGWQYLHFRSVERYDGTTSATRTRSARSRSTRSPTSVRSAGSSRAWSSST